MAGNSNQQSSPVRSVGSDAFGVFIADMRQGLTCGSGVDRSSQMLSLHHALLANRDQLANDKNGQEYAYAEYEEVENGCERVRSSVLTLSSCNPGASAAMDNLHQDLPSQQQRQLDGSVVSMGSDPRLSFARMRSSLACPALENRQSVGCWSDICQQLKQQQKLSVQVVVRKWWILTTPLLLLFLLMGLGVFGVVYAANRVTQQYRDYAAGALASTAISTVAGQLEIATFAVMTLSAYLTQQPNCTELNHTYNRLADVIFQWDTKKTVYQLQAMPAAVVKYIHPYPDPDLAEKLFGRDILAIPQYRNDTIKQIQARDQRLLLGPYQLVEGFKAIFVTFAIFLPAPDPLYDWGCGVQPYECPPDTCWMKDHATGGNLKLWGMATSLLRLDALKEGFELQKYADQGYLFRLRQEADGINREAIIDGTPEPPRNPVTLTLEKYNVKWVFEVEPEGGWEPVWREPCIAAVVVGATLVSALVLWLLLTREKHNLLLRAMLPRKVIRQLQRGAQTVVEEYHDPVTILFTDIVSYTEVASQLTPLQVVRLLNELYTEFDALTEKHGVYKVETIGDAFMCVSGCPIREDPVQAALRMAGMAQDMIRLVDRFVSRVAGDEMQVKIRVGLHSGPVVAGVIGQRMPRYCLFGDTVNTASRMESNSAPMSINVSSATADLLRAGGAVVVPYMGGELQPLLCAVTKKHQRRVSSPVLPPLPPAVVKAAEVTSELEATSAPLPALRVGAEQPSRHQPNVPSPLRQPASPQPLPRPRPSQPMLLPPPQSSLHDSEPPPPPSQQQQQQLQLHSTSEQAPCGRGGNRGTKSCTGAVGSGAPAPPTDAAHLVLHSRGRIHIKGKGPMVCYWLGRPPYNCPT